MSVPPSTQYSLLIVWCGVCSMMMALLLYAVYVWDAISQIFATSWLVGGVVG